MHIVSSSRSTILSDFPYLNTKSIYASNDETNDFQFFANKKRIFLEVNKKSGLEFLHIKNVSETEKEIIRIKKMTISNLFCVATPKQKNDVVALGLSNGQIKLLNHSTYEFTHKFSADARNSVTFLDYNPSDEYLSSVYENGNINIFGMKTKTKTDTINFDRNVTLTRFHPVKRFHLSMASHKGSVYIYDINSKQKIFTSINCHTAPCRDLCMSPALPDILLSVGYDCIINIFDTRKKTQPQQIKYNHPLSTVAISDCGNFFCVGNLKGELASYDLRNAKSFISTKKIHDSPVVRIGFVPNENDKNSSALSCGNYTNVETNVEARKSLANLDNLSHNRRDSFCDFLDFQSSQAYKTGAGVSVRRSSFDWDTISPRVATDHSYRNSLIPKLSVGGNPSIYIVKESNSLILTNTNEKENIPENVDAECAPGKILDQNKAKDRGIDDVTFGKLNNIREEKEEIDADVDAHFKNSVVNKLKAEQDIVGNSPTKDVEDFRKLPSCNKSTPHNRTRNSDVPNLPQPIDQHTYSNDIEKLRSEMNERFNQLEFEMKFHAERNKWNIFTQNSNLHNEQLKNFQKLQNTLDFLIQTDPFVNEFLRLKNENELLKDKVLQLSKNNF